VVTGVAELMLASAAADMPLTLGACAVSGQLFGREGLVSAPTLVDFESIPLAQMLCQRLALPIKVQTASVYALWGEQEIGVARGVADFLLFDLGPTLGLAAVIGGRVQPPAGAEQFPVGELYDPELVRLARSASVAGLVERLRTTTGDTLAGAVIAERAKAGDPAALAAVEGCGHALAAAIGFAHGRAPITMAVATGGTAALGNALLKPARTALANAGGGAGRVQLAIGALHPYSAAYGAALEAQSFAKHMPRLPAD
jgi:glucokinase